MSLYAWNRQVQELSDLRTRAAAEADLRDGDVSVGTDEIRRALIDFGDNSQTPAFVTEGSWVVYERVKAEVPADTHPSGKCDRYRLALENVRRAYEHAWEALHADSAHDEQLEVALAKVERYEAALRSIRGPADTFDPFMEKYRAAGGGYDGLQAIATAALKLPEWMSADSAVPEIRFDVADEPMRGLRDDNPSHVQEEER